MRKPADIVYGVDDKPPLTILVLAGLQNVAVMAIFLIFPLIVCREAGVSTTITVAVLSLSMLAMGIATLLQGLPGVGSGYLCPAIFTGAYISPSLLAAHAGGLPLVFGMTVFAGAIETGLARILNRLRPFFPPEIAGLVVLLVGITNAAVSVGYLANFGDRAGDRATALLVAMLTLLPMVALNVWTRGMLRLICALIGVLVGYAAAAAFGLLKADDFSLGSGIALFGLPDLTHLAWSFDVALVLPFTVGAVAVTLKAMAVVSVCQKLNDADWIRPDLVNVRRGVLADGLGNVVAGALGTFGVNPGPSFVGLSAATGVCSRQVSYAIAAIMGIAAFLPGIALALALMPKPVMAAALMFTACFTLTNGMQVITSRMLDSRKTFVIGLAVVASIGVEVFPQIADNAPGLLKPIVGSSLVFGTVLAFVMNILFRLGVRQRVTLHFDPGRDVAGALDDFLDQQGARWGARRDIIDRARFALHQLSEAVADHCEPRGGLEIAASFDEFNLDLSVSYAGKLLELPDQRPSPQEIRDSDDGLRRLSGFMLRRNADRAQSERRNDLAVVSFHFDH